MTTVIMAICWILCSVTGAYVGSRIGGGKVSTALTAASASLVTSAFPIISAGVVAVVVQHGPSAWRSCRRTRPRLSSLRTAGPAARLLICTDVGSLAGTMTAIAVVGSHFALI